MTSRIKSWGRRSAFNVQKMLWLMDELSLDYDHTELGGDFGGLDDPNFRAMNPHGKVPVIDDGGTVVWESHAILRYLASRYGEGIVWSADPREQSFSDRWMDWSLSRLQPDFMDLFWGYYRTPEPKRNWDFIKDAQQRCADDFVLLDTHLAGQPFLAGETFTVGDVPAGTALFRYFSLEIEYPDVPNVRAWYARLQERPGYRAHVMLPFDDMKGKETF